jgi:pilus assembly protein CpaF
MLQAMNTGHEGSMTTLHANSPRDALSRLEMMLLMNRLEAPLRALREQIASAVNLIVQVERQAGGIRRITNITEVVGMDQEMVMIQDLFIFRKQGVDAAGQARGHFESTGIPLRCRGRLEAAGIKLPEDMFRARALGHV